MLGKRLGPPAGGGGGGGGGGKSAVTLPLRMFLALSNQARSNSKARAADKMLTFS